LNSTSIIGTSRVTMAKWDAFAYLMAVHINMVKEIFAATPREVVPAYVYLDLYAGPGLYEMRHDADLAGRFGSPLIAVRRLKAAGIEFAPYFADSDPAVCDLLRTSLLRDGHGEHVGRVFKACCALSVDRLLCWHTTRNKYGLAFVDPNGHPDWEAIDLLARSDQWYNVDLLINVNATGHKRCKGRFKNLYKGRGFLSPTEYLRGLRKRYIWLWAPDESDSWQFTLAYCTNRKAPEFRKYTFHGIDSARGREIARLIDFPARERAGIVVPDGTEAIVT
jgi:hypothetical protein